MCSKFERSCVLDWLSLLADISVGYHYWQIYLLSSIGCQSIGWIPYLYATLVDYDVIIDILNIYLVIIGEWENELWYISFLQEACTNVQCEGDETETAGLWRGRYSGGNVIIHLVIRIMKLSIEYHSSCEICSVAPSDSPTLFKPTQHGGATEVRSTYICHR